MINYFEFFGIAIHPLIDEKALRKKFLTNSKALHPDFHATAIAEIQDRVLEQSTFNNEAYKVLSDFDQRLKHLLELKGVLNEEGKNTIPQEFLMEMMDINEGIMELKFDPSEELMQSTKNNIQQLENELQKSVQNILENYEDQHATESSLKQLGEFYLKRRYLLRIRKNLSSFAAH